MFGVTSVLPGIAQDLLALLNIFQCFLDATLGITLVLFDAPLVP